uniref:Vomeronasal type-1 receptor n=1 Tax=Romanomermis culicivorax TaxID=13658 RepID=A0A915J659_ROMCU
MTLGDSTERFFASVADVSWHSKAWFMIFVSLTRFTVLRNRKIFSHSLLTGVNRSDTKIKLYSSCSVVWLCYACLYSTYFFTRKPVYYLNFKAYSWLYETRQFFSFILHHYDIVHNVATCIILTLINSASLIVVRSRLKESPAILRQIVSTKTGYGSHQPTQWVSANAIHIQCQRTLAEAV